MSQTDAHHNVNTDPDWRAAAQQLEAGLQAMGLQLAETAQSDLLFYASEMLRWNKAYNLTAITTPKAVVARHLLDSLSVLPWIGPGLTVDIGTGAGLPGIPLAIAKPEQKFILLDSNGKRMRFLAHILRSLKIKNVELVTARAEQWQPDPAMPADPAESGAITQLVTRAFAPIPRQLEWCSSLLTPGVTLLAMTGKDDPDQLRNWPAGYTLRHSHPLTVPETIGGTIGARHLLEIVRE